METKDLVVELVNKFIFDAEKLDRKVIVHVISKNGEASCFSNLNRDQVVKVLKAFQNLRKKTRK